MIYIRSFCSFAITTILFLSSFSPSLFFFFFFNDTAPTEIYTLSLHDALPILPEPDEAMPEPVPVELPPAEARSEEHTSELQSRPHLVCRLLLEKKKKKSSLLSSLVRFTRL